MIRINLNDFFDKPLLTGFGDYVVIEKLRNRYNIDYSLDEIEIQVDKPIFSIHEDFFINLLRIRSIEYPSIEEFKNSVSINAINNIAIEKSFNIAIKKLIKARKQFDLSLPKEKCINE